MHQGEPSRKTSALTQTPLIRLIFSLASSMLPLFRGTQIAGTSHAPALELLKVFAYGTWSEYKAREAELPPLTEAQVRKLKKLSAVAFAAQSKTLGYDLLMRELQLASVRELEDLLIDCIYTGLISGRLDQQAGHLDVFSAVGRDVHPKELAGMAASLREWHSTATGLMGAVTTQMERFKQQGDENRKAQAELDEKVEAVKAALRNSQESGEGYGPMDSEMALGFDDDKMRKSGRMKGRHVGSGGKHGARM